MSKIIFLCFDCARSPRPPEISVADVMVEIWRPELQPLPPPCALGLGARMVWPAFHFLGIFRNRDLAMVRLEQETRCVHRTILFPPFFRFPFMQRSDLQCGDIWTDPAERHRGLAAAGVTAALHHAWQPGRKIWYLTEAANEPSLRLAERAGFQPVGHGRRTRRLGLKIFGQFVVTTLSHPIR